MLYGRDEESWTELVAAGREFLEEQARSPSGLTNYSAVSREVADRTGHRAFDFQDPSERAAMGHLLAQVTRSATDRLQQGLMLSAVVIYQGGNDPGPGFYSMAVELGFLPAKASADARLAFWSAQVKALQDRR